MCNNTDIKAEIKRIWEVIEIMKDALEEMNNEEEYEISESLDQIDHILSKDFAWVTK